MHAGLWTSSATQRLPRGVLIAGLLALGGCGLSVGSGTVGTTTVGDTATGEHVKQYAFARARVPIVVEGQVSKVRRGYALKATLTTGAPKYAVDAALSVRVAERAGDRFKVSIDKRYLLAEVSSLSTTGAAAPADDKAPGLREFSAAIEKALQPPPTPQPLTRTTSERLPAFRIEKEIDPAVPEEIAALEAEIAREAAGWGLKVRFQPQTAEAQIAGRKVMLAAMPSATCSAQICFRLPVPYRISLEPDTTGWRGRVETRVWLPNDGPIGALAVRDSKFGDSGVRAIFQDGMLKSITAREPGVAETFIALPVVTSSLPSSGR